MRFSNIALAASAVGSALAAESICDKYTTALLMDNNSKNQLTLLTLLVNTAVIGNYTGGAGSTKTNAKLPGSMVDVPGILASGQKFMGEKIDLVQYFDGSLLSTNMNNKAVSVNFLDGGGATPIIKSATSSGKSGSNQAALLESLYSYFGVLLGCSMVGKGSFPAYAGSTSMFDVHRYMALDAAEVGYFITQVGLAAASFGVSKSDINAAAEALSSTFGERCAPAAAVPSTANKQLQAICVESDCTKAKDADCSAYPKITEPKSASSSSGGSGGSSGSGSGSGGSSGSGSGSGSSGSSGSGSGGSGAATSLTVSGGAAILAVAAGAAALL